MSKRLQRKCKAVPHRNAFASTAPEVALLEEMVQILPVVQFDRLKEHHLIEDLNNRTRNGIFRTILPKGRKQRRCKTAPYQQQQKASASTASEVAPPAEISQPLPVVRFNRLEKQHGDEDPNNRTRNGTFKTTLPKGRKQRKCKTVPYQQQQKASASTVSEVASLAEISQPLPVVQFDRLKKQHVVEDPNNRTRNGTFKTTLPKGWKQRKCKTATYQQQQKDSASTVSEVALLAELVHPLPVVQFDRLEGQHLVEDPNSRTRNGNFRNTLPKRRKQRQCKTTPYQQQQKAFASTVSEVASLAEISQPLPVVQFNRLEKQRVVEDPNNRTRNGTFKTTLPKGRKQRQCTTTPYQQQQNASASTAPEVAPVEDMLLPLPDVQLDSLVMQHIIEDLNNRPIMAPNDVFMRMAEEVVQELKKYSRIPWNPASVRCLAEIGEVHYIRTRREERPFCRMYG